MTVPDGLGGASLARRTLFRLLRTVSRACRIGLRAFDRLAAGTLTAADLRAAQIEEWRGFNASDDEIDAGLLPWERRFYAACLTPGERVLLVGCGAGRDLVALLAQGLTVDGLEPIAAAASEARRQAARRGLGTNITAGRIDDHNGVGPYDVYVFSYFCYTYIRTAEARIRALASIRRASPQARVLISAPRAAGIDASGTALLRIGNRIAATDWRAERGDVFEIDDSGGVQYMHAFANGEIEQELRVAGLQISRVISAGDLQLIEAIADPRPDATFPAT